ncbi:AAA family ATPase [Ruminococcaceae bacterium OttesenSCG-928-L11]|nr:AAA family ATPase [Ruminococcaceae bacterium OttesenSCG-928-L11]
MAKLKIITMRDIEAEPVSWLWEPYIPAGKITIIQGDPGDGKTTMALAVAAAVTRGKRIVEGGTATLAPSAVIFQTAEDGLADTIKPRLEQLGADCGRVHVIDEDEQSLSLSDERIEAAIVKMKAKLFILDPLQAYLGGADMHSTNGVRPLMKQLGTVVERTDCAIVIIGHLNKKGGKSQYRGLGSIDIYAAARSVLTVGRISDTERAVVHGKSNLAPAGVSLSFELDPVSGFRWLGERDIGIDDLLSGKSYQPENQFSKARRLIETTLRNGSVPAVEIMQAAEEQGISPKTLNRAKSALGVISIKRQGKWFWELPIDVEYTVCDEDGQHGQDSQHSQHPPVTSLAILPGGVL